MTVPGARAASSAAAAGPRPLFLQIAAILLFVSAGLTLLLPVSLLVSREFAGCSIAVATSSSSPTTSSSTAPSPSASASGSASASQTPTLSQSDYINRVKECQAGTGSIRSNTSQVSGFVGGQVLRSLLPVIILAALGFYTLRGAPIMRWVVVGVWFISNLYPLVSFSPFGLYGAFGYGIYPPVYLTILTIGTIAFTLAAIFLQLPSVTRYLNARRPIRTAANRPPGGGGGLFGGMFRPPPGGAGGNGGTGVAGGSGGYRGRGGAGSRGVSMDKPADGNPPNTGSNTGGNNGGGNPATTRPAKSRGTGGRPGGPRGKSRRS